MSALPKMILVEYEDMSSCDASFSVEEAREYQALRLHVVGFLVDENDERIVLAHEWRDPNQDKRNTKTEMWRYLIALPKVGIKRLVYLEGLAPGPGFVFRLGEVRDAYGDGLGRLAGALTAQERSDAGS